VIFIYAIVNGNFDKSFSLLQALLAYKIKDNIML